MLWTCILLPQLALDAVLRRLSDASKPLALVSGPTHLRSLHAVNASAAQAGLKPGMRLSAAHALLADVATVVHDAQDEMRWHRFLAAWAYRHSSLVSAQWPGCVVLEARASFQLFGPWPRFETRLREELTALGFTHRIALAPTPRAARVLAGLRDGLAVTSATAMHDILDKVPVRRAALPKGSGERLYRMGVRDLRALRALPRDSVRRRFGVELLAHVDRLYGDADDPLEHYAPPDHFDSRIELGYEVEHHPPLLFPLRRLIGDLCTYLSIRDGGVQHFVLRLEHASREHAGEGHAGEGQAGRGHEDIMHTDVDVGLLAAEREPAMLFELTRNRLERVSIPKPVVAMRLRARELPPFIPASRDLFDTRAQQSLPWPQLRERLRARLGDDAVYRVVPAGDPRPERAWRRDDGRPLHATMLPPRPSWLLPHPVPLRGHGLRIVSGPERLESGWWDGEDARRDYYVLETAQGQRAWAFAPVGEREGWMLHGWFA